AKDLELRRIERARAADGETGPGKGLTVEDVVGHAEHAADLAHLVLEEQPQRLDEPELQRVRKATDVAVALDGDARTLVRDALDDVRVERALHEELGAVDLLGFALEDVDEDAADGLALLLGVRDAGEGVEELVRGVDVDHLEVEVIAEHADHLLALVATQEPVVDEDAGEVVADGLVHEHRRHRGVDAAREAA